MAGVAVVMGQDALSALDLTPDDVPVFWACGVTPQAVIEASRPPWAITHAPGHMFVTDVLDGRR